MTLAGPRGRVRLGTLDPQPTKRSDATLSNVQGRLLPAPCVDRDAAAGVVERQSEHSGAVGKVVLEVESSDAAGFVPELQIELYGPKQPVLSGAVRDGVGRKVPERFVCPEPLNLKFATVLEHGHDLRQTPSKPTRRCITNHDEAGPFLTALLKRPVQHTQHLLAIANVAVDEVHGRTDDAREAVDHARLTVAQIVENHGAVAGASNLDRDVAADEARAASQQNGCARQACSAVGSRT